MKTKLSILLFSLLILVGWKADAQDAGHSLSDAKSSYSSGNLDDARFALEQALQQIDQIIGNEILKVLPTNMSGMNYVEQDDNVVGTSLGFAGLFVDRNYIDETKSASIDVIGDSPLMAGINAILAMPAIVTAGNDNQKRIKIDGYKSLIQKDSDSNGMESYTVQIPANTLLISFNVTGFNENEVIAMANTIPVTQIVKIAQ